MHWQPHDERRLAVMTNWGFFGSFGLCFAITGFRGGDLLPGLAGFVLLAVAFAAHVLINHIFGSRFSKGEVALGFVVFALSLSSFVVSWIVRPNFGAANIAIGLAGFGLLLTMFVFYMIATHGVRGSIDMIDAIRNG